jgi:hypothetical protein
MFINKNEYKDGRTAAKLAMRYGHPQIARYLDYR